jgi:predicted RNA-binding protein YlxR (DUF448 family)
VAGGREPERTCVGCRGKASKAAFVRVVRGTDGSVAVDPSGKAPGRGAYLHRDPACVDAAVKKGTLWRALRTGASPDVAARLRREIEGASRV